MPENKIAQEVAVEVELAEDGEFKSLIKVRIMGTERHACQMVKEAVLLAIQTALGDQESAIYDDRPAVH